jgi:very-short-patch-repair endonuclease
MVAEPVDLYLPREPRSAQWARRWREAADRAAEDPLLRDAVDVAREQGYVLTTQQALACGMCSADLRRLTRRRSWTAPRRGVRCVLPAADPFADEPHGARPEVAAAAVALQRPDHFVSHESAAAMYGLPLLALPARPRLTVDRANGGGQLDALVHAARVLPEEVTTWFGVALLTPARTVVDIARNAGIRAGLVATDAALSDGLISYAELDDAVARARNWPGVKTARRLLALGCDQIESPLESLSRLIISEADLPLPEPQAWVNTDMGRFRVDGLWPDRGVILEADGLLKYRTTDLDPDDDDVDPLVREKLRQEAIERAGYRVVRVNWDDVMHRRSFTIFRITSALRQGGTRSFGTD